MEETAKGFSMRIKIIAFLLVVVSWFNASPVWAIGGFDEPNDQRVFLDVPGFSTKQQVGRVTCSSISSGLSGQIWVNASLGTNVIGSNPDIEIPAFPVATMTAAHGGNVVKATGETANLVRGFQTPGIVSFQATLPVVGAPPYVVLVAGDAFPLTPSLGFNSVGKLPWIAADEKQSFTLVCSGDINKPLSTKIREQIKNTPANKQVPFTRKSDTTASDIGRVIAGTGVATWELVWGLLQFFGGSSQY